MAYQLVLDQAGEAGYIGKAERCTYEFSTIPEQIPGEQWLATQFIDRHVSELSSQNSKLLHLRAWRDAAPTWQTNYKVEITASASPLWWNLIIVGVLAVIAMVLTWRIVSVVDLNWSEVAPTIPWIAIAIVAVVLFILAGRRKHGT